MTLVAFVQLIMIYFGGEVFRSVPLQRIELINAALMAMTVFPADLVCKISLKLKGR